MRQSAVLMKLTIIGEASNHISKNIRDRYPDVSWSDAIGLRNVVAHDYFGIDVARIWDTTIVDVPVLRTQVAVILAAEYPES